jgi:hypothetical protein
MPIIVENQFTAPLKCNTLNDDFDNYKKTIAETIERNVKILYELPPPRNFLSEDLEVFIRAKIKSDLEKDKLFEKTVEVNKYANSIFDCMEKYFANIFTLHISYKNMHSCELFEISKGFLNSDLPEQFLKAISNSLQVETDFIDLFDKRIKKEHLTLLGFKNNRTKFERLCKEHNGWSHEFAEKIDKIAHDRTKLIWYVDINNSTTVENCFKDKFIKVEVIDKKLLLKLIDTLEQTTSELEVLVTTNLESQCLPTRTMDDSTRAITAMMEILNR